MKNGTQISSLNTDSKNIIEYLIENRNLNSENLLFIINIVKDASLITPNALCRLIYLYDFIFIKEILQYKYYDETFIKNLLFDYKNKTKRSKNELLFWN